MISVLMPSRGRPELCHQSRQQAIDMADGEIEVLVYVDEDDPLKSKYKDVIVGKPLHSGKAMRVLAEQAKGDIMFFGCDDFVWRTKGWNKIAEQKMPAHQLSVLCPRDMPNVKVNKSQSPMFTKRLIEVAGWWPDGFNHFGPDTWLVDIGRKADQLIFLDDVLIEHVKVHDATYSRARENGDGGKAKDILNNTAKDRERIAAKIKELIRGQ